MQTCRSRVSAAVEAVTALSGTALVWPIRLRYSCYLLSERLKLVQGERDHNARSRTAVLTEPFRSWG